MAHTPTIGLEVHVELKTRSKMFCSCKNDPDEKRPNYLICPVCMGHPGTLPAANEEAIKKVIKTGLALNCRIAEESKFDRKNYFYPDLPKGYQISQYDKPLCFDGFLEIPQNKFQIPNPKSQTNSNDQNSKFKKIRIRRVHLEEDTGRLLHPEGANYSLVDFNRAGIPLMELVTEPDIGSGEEARKFSEELQKILRYLGVSSADMEKGQMRVEINISLSKSKIPALSAGRQNPKSKMGTKVEIKNLNSFRSVEKAIDYEIRRQAEILEAGGKVIQETRGWHDKKEKTFLQREKEEAHDYRYFPEPDLPILRFDENFIEEIRTEIPELPEQKRKRFLKEYGLDEKTIEIFVNNKDLSEYYEKIASEFEEWLEAERGKNKISEKEEQKIFKLAANYLISDTQGLLCDKPFVESEFKITPENFAEFIKMIYTGQISSKTAKMVLADMFNTGADPSSIIDENNLRQITDGGKIEKIVKEVILKNPKAVSDYKSGKLESFQFLIGQIMSYTKGRANPDAVRKILFGLLTD